VSTIDSKRTIPVQNALPTTALVAEAGTITPADPTFSTAISVEPHKLVTAVTMSQEFIEDAIGNGGIGSGLQYVADKCGLSIALKQEEYYTVGTGSAQPQGICDTSGGVTQGVDLGDAITTLTSDEVIDAVHAVPVAYRNSPRFRWLLSDTALKVIRKLKDTAGYYVYSPAASINATNVVGLPGTIYGVPYSVGQYVPTARTARATATPSSATSTTSRSSTAPASPRWWIPTRRRRRTSRRCTCTPAPTATSCCRRRSRRSSPPPDPLPPFGLARETASGRL
jgi:HK97 family phage major capsid protein